MHKCDNPTCCRPDHLELGTNAANRADSVRKARHAFGERGGHAKLTAEDVRTIRSLRGEVTYVKLAARFGVTLGAIGHIMTSRNWRNLG